MHAAPEETAPALQACAELPAAGRTAEPLILVVDADRAERESLVSLLASPGLRIVERSGAEEALLLARERSVDMVVAAQGPEERSGVQLLEAIRALHPGAGRALISDSVDMGTMCDAVNRAGVTHLLARPVEPAAVARLRAEALAVGVADPGPAADIVRGSPGASYGIIGSSPPVRNLIDMIEKIGPTDSTVLVTGETGTGKELVGSAIHASSRRRGRIFSAINSAALPETLLESELFGHRRGAFTGASANRRGLFEHANGGTVFLDELGEMPLSMQAKLLRFLQTGEIRPVGGESSRCVDVRLVSATNKDLEEEVRSGRFREDLYYRLAVIPVTVPSLRERIGDIPLLVEHILSARSGQDRVEIDDEAMDALMRHSWPGNVRELQNVLERGLALCSGNRVRITDLPGRVLSSRSCESPGSIQSLPGLERKHILETLDRVGWNRKQAASLLEISTTTLWRRLKEFGIDEATRNPRSLSRSG